MQSTMMHYPLTLTHLLERAGRYFPSVEIVSRLPDGSIHRMTNRDFYRRSRLLAAALTRAGLKRGDRVGTLMWNHYAHHEAFFGVPVAGGVLHTLNLRLSVEESDVRLSILLDGSGGVERAGDLLEFCARLGRRETEGRRDRPKQGRLGGAVEGIRDQHGIAIGSQTPAEVAKGRA